MDSDIQSKSETAHSVAHEPKYLIVSILPHETKVLAIFAFSQTQLVEVVTWQVGLWYTQEDMG